MEQTERIWAVEFGDPERPLLAHTWSTGNAAAVAAAAQPAHQFFDYLGRRLTLRDDKLKDSGAPADEEVRALVRAALQAARAVAEGDSGLLMSPDGGAYDSLEDFDAHTAWLLAAPSAADLIGALQPALYPENEISRRRLCKLLRTC